MNRRLPLIGAFLLATAPLLLTPPPCGAAGITVAAVGDVMMGSDYPEAKLPPHRGRRLLAEAAPILRRSDLALANLEGVLLADGTPAKRPVTGRSYLFRTPPGYASNLKEAGFSMVSLANNHSLDFGSEGLASTRRALEKAGVAFSSKDGEIAEFSREGLRVAVLSLSFGPPPRSIVFPRRPLAEIARLSERYDILILSVHAGAEGRGALHTEPGMERFLDEPRGDLVRFAHDAIDRGADLVVAHGPHVPRGMELYRGRLVAYSLGNFATYGGVSVAGESGFAPLLVARLAPDGSFLSGTLHSFLQTPFQGPRRDPKRRALRLIESLSAADFPDSQLLFGDSGKITLREPGAR